MFVRKVWWCTESKDGKGMFVRKIDEKSETWADFIQLYESTISIDVEFYKASSGFIWFWVHPHGKYCIEGDINLNSTIDCSNENYIFEINKLFKTLGLLMENKNGIVAIYPTAYTAPGVIKQIEEITERVSRLTDTVFWFCIKKMSTDEIDNAKKYFDYLGVTEEEWLLGL